MIFGNLIKKHMAQRIKEDAERLFQVRECEGELWLTFNGELIAPMLMFDKAPCEILEILRKRYIERRNKEEGIEC